MSDLLPLFARNLRFLRKQAGLTQEQLADISGLHRTYVGAIERCERNISLKNVERLAKALGVPPITFFQEELTQKRAQDNDNMENK